MTESGPAAADPAPGRTVHVERDVIFGVGYYRNLLAEGAGLAVDAPPAVTTGCGQQHPLADTSRTPESVTCPQCREWAAAGHVRQAELAEKAAGWAGNDENLAARVSPDELAANAAQHRELAARYQPDAPS